MSQLGHDLYDGHVSINFVGRRWVWYGFSAVLVAIAMAGLLGPGLNMGVEFSGGVEHTVTLPAERVNQDTADEVREGVEASGVPGTESVVVTTSGDQAIRIQTGEMPADDVDRVRQVITEEAGVATADISTQEVGASWGRQVAERAIRGVVVFLVLVTIMIWVYFREWKMSVGALVALAHDLVITVGIYALVGFEVTPATVTGVLTILGFSLYDTVVVFDKVRENTHELRKGTRTYAELANLAVNQTLVRSINTSIVAILPVAALLYVGALALGAGALKDLSLSLFIGMIAGIYSSVFIATPLVVHLKEGEKEISDSDRRAKARAKREAADPYSDVPAAIEGQSWSP